MTIIRLSAGHSKGLTHNRGGVLFNEGDQNLKFTDKLMQVINRDYNVNISEIRRSKGEVDHSLATRSAFGNGADLFYSAHSNALNGKTRGVEIFLSYQSLKYLPFAKKLSKTIADTLGIPNRGVKFRNYHTGAFESESQANASKTNYYGELRGNKAKCALLVEHCFHDNIDDARTYVNNFDKLIENIAKLIADEFRLQRKSGVKPVANKTVPGKLYRVQVGAYADKANADKLVAELKKKGYSPFIVESGAVAQVAKPQPKKTNEQIAREVLEGKWGNGSDRKARLEKAGYNYSAIQAIVNKLA